jgi:hypothetical protein
MSITREDSPGSLVASESYYRSLVKKKMVKQNAAVSGRSVARIGSNDGHYDERFA